MGVPFWSVLQWRSCGGVQSNRWDQTALRPLRVPPTHKCIQTLTLYRTHTHHIDVHTKDSCPYLPTFKTELITSQSSVTQWALVNKRRGVGIITSQSFIRKDHLSGLTSRASQWWCRWSLHHRLHKSFMKHQCYDSAIWDIINSLYVVLQRI